SGRLLAAAHRGRTIVLWDVATGKARARFQGHTDHIQALAFSPDGRLLASASNDHTVRLWSVAQGEARSTLLGHTRAVRSVAFNPSGRLLASAGDDRTVRVWEVPTGKEVLVLPAGVAGISVSAVTFSADGRSLFAAAPFEPVVTR